MNTLVIEKNELADFRENNDTCDPSIDDDVFLSLTDELEQLAIKFSPIVPFELFKDYVTFVCRLKED
jgi:hypothetical protein